MFAAIFLVSAAVGTGPDHLLVDEIAHPDAAVLLATVAEVVVGSRKDNFLVGTLHMHKVEVARGRGFASTLDITFRCSTVSAKKRPEGWYPCPHRGDVYGLALRQDEGRWQVTAESRAMGAEPSEIKNAVAIEGAQVAVERKAALLRDALIRGRGTLRAYATAAIGERAVLPRPFAIATIDAAVGAADSGDWNDRLSIAMALYHGIMHREEGDPLNAKVIGILARGVVRAPRGQVRENWFSLLASQIQPAFSDDAKEDAVRRAALIRAVGSPSREEVIAALEELRASVAAEGQERIASVLQTWRQADIGK